MPQKSFQYAYYEGLAQEMRRDKNVIYQYEYQSPVASYGQLKPINLDKEFGKPRVNLTGIDELWYVGSSLGAARTGLRPVCIIPNMAEALGFHLLAEGAKIPWGTAMDDKLPCVIVQETTGQGVGGGQSHADYECDSWYMHIPGLKLVVPATAYDAKGLLISAIRTDDPVMYIFGGALRTVSDEVPDELYEVPIGKAAVRQKGTDLTIVTSGHGVLACGPAVDTLKKEGISVEYIDLVTLKPLDRKTLVESVRKTGRLLTVDQTYYTLCPGAEVVATCAEGCPGARFRRIAFPDTAPGGAPEMIAWQKPNAAQIVKAAKMLLKA
jgi:pyruvate dehydrogenase E1 component beta subunit